VVCGLTNSYSDGTAQATRADLIAFDSPFLSQGDGGTTATNDNAPEAGFEFETTWNSLERSNSRGWCDLTIENLVRQLQASKSQLRVIAADQSPFQGLPFTYRLLEFAI
jgi:AP-4 complex subunit epsilon-1